MKTSACQLSFIAVCSLLLLLAACSVREDTEECMQYALTVKAVDTEGNDLTGSGVLTSVDLYLFDQTGFVRRVPAGSSSDFLFAHSRVSTVTLVAWGNLKADSLQLPDVAVGASLEQAQLSLLRDKDGCDRPITDLFYSRQVIVSGGGAVSRGLVEEDITLVLERRAAGMSIRTYYLSERIGDSPEPCHFVVRGTSSALNFLGEPMNSNAGYVPFTTTNASGDLYAAPFRIFPTRERQQRTEIDIYQGSTRVVTLTTDSRGNPLYALPGQQLNVEVDFSMAVVWVTVSVVPWGQVSQEEEM